MCCIFVGFASTFRVKATAIAGSKVKMSNQQAEEASAGCACRSFLVKMLQSLKGEKWLHGILDLHRKLIYYFMLSHVWVCGFWGGSLLAGGKKVKDRERGRRVTDVPYVFEMKCSEKFLPFMPIRGSVFSPL